MPDIKYTLDEEKALNAELRRWQRKQLNAVKQIYFDCACNKMTDIDRATWRLIANAKSYKDVNWLCWQIADEIIDKYCLMARRGR